MRKIQFTFLLNLIISGITSLMANETTPGPFILISFPRTISHFLLIRFLKTFLPLNHFLYLIKVAAAPSLNKLLTALLFLLINFEYVSDVTNKILIVCYFLSIHDLFLKHQQNLYILDLNSNNVRLINLICWTSNLIFQEI